MAPAQVIRHLAEGNEHEGKKREESENDESLASTDHIRQDAPGDDREEAAAAGELENAHVPPDRDATRRFDNGEVPPKPQE